MSRADARTSQKEVEGQGMKYWREGCEIMKTDAIQVDNIDPFLDYMRDSYEGVYIQIVLF